LRIKKAEPKTTYLKPKSPCRLLRCRTSGSKLLLILSAVGRSASLRRRVVGRDRFGHP
jgi:hypothetical protein